MACLRELLAEFENRGVRYCILHGWQSLPDHLPSDLDIVVHPSDLNKLERILRNSESIKLVQLVEYKTSCYRFDLAFKENEATRFIPLDTASDYRWDGFVFFEAEELLADRKKWNGFWVAAPKVEFAYLLAKRVSKGIQSDRQKIIRLQELCNALGENAYVITLRLFGASLGEKVIRWITNSDWENLEAHAPSLKQALHWEVVKRDPLNPVCYWASELKRIWLRLKYPTGLFVVVLGPDAAGKSTLIQHLQNNLAPLFRRSTVFHLYPNLFEVRKGQGPVTNPHGKSLRSWLTSLLKMLYYLVDYDLGYLIKIWLQLVRSNVVLFDRYYDDLLVDPCRYRYGGPKWLVSFFRFFIPKPDLFLILDVPEEQIIARKQEVSHEEIKRQRQAYCQLASELPNAILLDGSLKADFVAQSAEEIILDYMQERYLNRRSNYFHRNDFETLNWLETILCSSGKGRFVSSPLLSFPHSASRSGGSAILLGGVGGQSRVNSFNWLSLKDGRGYLIPSESSEVAVNALDIYNAQNFRTKFLKQLLGIGLRTGMAQPFLRKASLISEGDANFLLLEYIKKLLGQKNLSFAVSLGTPGTHRKPVIGALSSDGAILAYCKVGWDEATNVLVQRDAEALRRMMKSHFTSFVTPRVLHSGWWNGKYLCVQSVPAGKMNAVSGELTSQCLNAAKELAASSLRQLPLAESDFWKNLITRVEKVPDVYYRSVLEQGVNKVKECSDRKHVPFHFRHGDFTPWNMKRTNGRLLLFDWEYFDPVSSCGWDIFHFFVQTMQLLNKKTPGDVCRELQKGKKAYGCIMEFIKGFEVEEKLIKPSFLMYLLDRLSFYALEKPLDFHSLNRLTTMIGYLVRESEVE